MDDNRIATGEIKDYMKADMDDIIFQYRNKSYGGYLLRKLYSTNMTKGYVVATLLFLLLICAPLIAKIVRANLPEEELISAEVTLAEPPPLDKNTPPPPPPPELPPPPKKATIAFVKPVIKKDEEVIEEIPPPDVEELKDIEISTKTQEGDENGVPDGLVDEPAPPPAVVEEVVEKPDEIFKVVEQKPEFPDGEAAMLKFIYDNIKYPSIARENGVEGTVYVSFVVEKDGSITDVKVVRDIGAGCGEESMRVVKKMPRWQPGKQRGRPVRVQFNLPVKYKLQ